MGMDAFLPPQEEVVAAVRSEQERAVNTAYRLEDRIVTGIAAIRHQWAQLAGDLYEFQSTNAWQTLGYDTLEQWLSGPGIEMSRRMFFALTEAYRELVVNRGVKVDQLAKVDMTKALEVLPALRRGQVDVETAMADCEVLTRTDLRDRYSGRALPPLSGPVDDQAFQADDFHYENCPTCGSRIKVKDE
jgi:hypothetical protein